jgi:sulfate adenylyltransferase subunit 2
MTDAAFLEPDLASVSAAPWRAADADHLGWLESEAIHVLREVAGQCQHPALLFSGGKDSLVLLRLAEKAFRPGAFPFPLLHIDTGHNFPVIAFRIAVPELGERLIVRRRGLDRQGGSFSQIPMKAANRHQSVTLLMDRPSSASTPAPAARARRGKGSRRERVFVSRCL